MNNSLINPTQIYPQQPQQQQQKLTELKIKQQYFRTHIDPDQYDSFGEFCSKTKGHLNIDLWTLKQVHQLVDNFQVWKQYFGNQKPKPVDFLGTKEQNDPLFKKFHDGSMDDKYTSEPQSKLIYLTPQVIKVKPKVQNSPQQKEKTILSASQVMDLLSFTPVKSEPYIHKIQEPYSKQQTPTKSQQQILVKHSSQKSSPQKNTNQNILPLTQIIKLHPINEQPLQPQKRYSEPSLSSSQMFPKQSLNIPKIYKQEFEDTIKCKKAQSVSFQKIKSVSIKKHEIINKAFFLPDYVMYHVELQPMNIVCKRNYDDFKRLYETLNKFYPGSKLPYLQSNSWLSETNIEFIKKQKISLQYFLNELIRHQSFKDSLALYQFLTVTDHKSIKRKFQQYDSTPNPKSIQNLENPQGLIKVKLLNADNHFIQKASSFSQEITQFLNQYNDWTLNAISNYDALISNMSAISKLIKGFKKKTEQFQETQHKLSLPIQSQLRELPSTLKVWQKLINSEYNSLSAKKDILFQKVLQYTKYQQSNIQSICQLLTKRTQMQQNYLYQVENEPTSPSTTESKPKPKDYLSPQLLPFKYGILQASENLTVSKYHLAYLNTKLKQQFILEFEYLGRGLRELLNQRLQEFLEKDKNELHETILKIVENRNK